MWVHIALEMYTIISTRTWLNFDLLCQYTSNQVICQYDTERYKAYRCPMISYPVEDIDLYLALL